MLHLVATDMDGTFLSPATAAQGHANGFVSSRSIAAASSLAASGVVFTIATGRPAPALQDHVDALGLELPCICFNGAAVLRMAPRTPPRALRLSTLPPPAVASVLAFADATGLCVSYSLFDRAVARVASPAQQELLDEYMRLEGVTQTVHRRLWPRGRVHVDLCSCTWVDSFSSAQVVGSSEELLSLPPPLKLVLLTPTPNETAARARAAVGSAAHVIAAEMHIEFLTPGVNKGTALEWLCGELELPLSSAVAFGDNDNDIEMLKVQYRCT